MQWANDIQCIEGAVQYTALYYTALKPEQSRTYVNEHDTEDFEANENYILRFFLQISCIVMRRVNIIDDSGAWSPSPCFCTCCTSWKSMYAFPTCLQLNSNTIFSDAVGIICIVLIFVFAVYLPHFAILADLTREVPITWAPPSNHIGAKSAPRQSHRRHRQICNKMYLSRLKKMYLSAHEQSHRRHLPFCCKKNHFGVYRKNQSIYTHWSPKL